MSPSRPQHMLTMCARSFTSLFCPNVKTQQMKRAKLQSLSSLQFVAHLCQSISSSRRQFLAAAFLEFGLWRSPDILPRQQNMKRVTDSCRRGRNLQSMRWVTCSVRLVTCTVRRVTCSVRRITWSVLFLLTRQDNPHQQGGIIDEARQPTPSRRCC